MKRLTGNEYLVKVMHDLIITAEDLHIRSDISVSLIQSWMCGRRVISKSAAETVFSLASALNGFAWDRFGSDFAWKNYNVKDLAASLVLGYYFD